MKELLNLSVIYVNPFNYCLRAIFEIEGENFCINFNLNLPDTDKEIFHFDEDSLTCLSLSGKKRKLDNILIGELTIQIRNSLESYDKNFMQKTQLDVSEHLKHINFDLSQKVKEYRNEFINYVKLKCINKILEK